MRRCLVAGVIDLSVRVGECAGIFLETAVEGRVEFDIPQIDCNSLRLVVVENSAIGENGATNAEVEDAGIAL